MYSKVPLQIAIAQRSQFLPFLRPTLKSVTVQYDLRLRLSGAKLSSHSRLPPSRLLFRHSSQLPPDTPSLTLRPRLATTQHLHAVQAGTCSPFLRVFRAKIESVTVFARFQGHFSSLEALKSRLYRNTTSTTTRRFSRSNYRATNQVYLIPRYKDSGTESTTITSRD